MSHEPKYKRVLIKLSGESLAGPDGVPVDAARAWAVADEIAPVVEMDVQVAIVIGGGNLIRGRDLRANPHVQRPTADAMGMFATVINALALRDTLESHRIPARVMSARPMGPACETFGRDNAIRHLDAGRVVVLAGGTGNPFFTTDTCASLRALEIGAEAVLKATNVDGVYYSDPLKNPDAKRYERLTYQQVLADQLGVMDLTAISMCMENDLPIVVFEFAREGNLARAVRGMNVGTTVGRE